MSTKRRTSGEINPPVLTISRPHVSPGKSYRYMVRIEDQSESSVLFVASVVETPDPRTLTLRSYPNPFNPVTAIQYHVPEKVRAKVEVFDVSGARIITLADRIHKSGRHETRWNGRDAFDIPVSSGVYFVRLTAGKLSVSEKIVLLR